MYRALIFAIPLALSAGACASVPDFCRNLPAASDDMSVAQLECVAKAGDKRAMLALGKRYEAGIGVGQDFARAARLYNRAATEIPGTIAVYSPPVRQGGRGQVIFVNNPNAGPGLAEAQYRLGRLYLDGRGVKKDSDRGNKLIRRAVSQGYRP